MTFFAVVPAKNREDEFVLIDSDADRRPRHISIPLKSAELQRVLRARGIPDNEIDQIIARALRDGPLHG
jgi:hypothetical protein